MNPLSLRKGGKSALDLKMTSKLTELKLTDFLNLFN